MHFNLGEEFNMNNVRKKVSRFIKNYLLVFIPEKIILAYLRKRLKVKEPGSKIPRDLKFKIATEKSEVRDALALVQGCYKKINVIDKNKMKQQLRLTKYTLLPTSIIFVAIWKNKIIGTISLVVDSKFGIPIDSICDLSEERKKDVRIAEISSLAIDSKYSSIKGINILFYLTNMLIKFAIHANIEKLFFATHPRAKYFYKAFYLAESFKSQSKMYKLLSNAPAFCQYTSLLQAKERMAEAFKKNLYSENIYTLLFEKTDLENHYYFEGRLGKIENSSYYNQEIFQSVFLQETDFIDDLKIKDLKILLDFYMKKDEKILNQLVEFSLPKTCQRGESRLPIYLNGLHLKPQSNTIIKSDLKVWNCSLNGLEISIEDDELAVSDSAYIKIWLNSKTQIYLEVICQNVRRQFGLRYGVRIISKSSNKWNRFIQSELNNFPQNQPVKRVS